MAPKQRLIYANELEAKMCGLCDEFGTDHLFIDAIVYEIGNAPTVDAVEVVRCRDCEYGCEDHEDAYLCNNGFNGLIGFTRGDDFCSYGERRGGE